MGVALATCCINDFNEPKIPYCEEGLYCDMDAGSSTFSKCISKTKYECERCSNTKGCYMAKFETFDSDCATAVPVADSLIEYTPNCDCYDPYNVPNDTSLCDTKCQRNFFACAKDAVS